MSLEGLIMNSALSGLVLYWFLFSVGVRSPTEAVCRVIFENEQDNSSLSRTQRKRSLVTSEPQHVTLIVFGIGMVNRTHLEADIGGLTMEAELKRIHGSFTLKEKMKGRLILRKCVITD